MKKTILSLTAVLAMFASVPAFASPVVDSAKEVSASSMSTITEPQIKIERITMLDVPRSSSSFVDGRSLSGKVESVIESIVDKDQTKKFHRYQLSKGQKLIFTMGWYDTFKDKKLIQEEIDSIQKIEKTIEEDGYYAIDLIAPSNRSDVDQYKVVYGIRIK